MKIIFNEEQIKNLMIAHCAGYRNPNPWQSEDCTVHKKSSATLITVSTDRGLIFVGEVTIE